MYTKLVYSPNTSLVNLSTDVSGLITGTITTLSDLKSADKKKTSIVITEPSPWVLHSDRTGLVNQKIYSVLASDETVSYMSLTFSSSAITVGIYEYWDAIRNQGINPAVYPAYISLDLTKGGELRIHATQNYVVMASVLAGVWSSGQGAMLVLTRSRTETHDVFDPSRKWAAGVGGASEIFLGSTVDASGHAYVVGFSESAENMGGGADAMIIRYDLNGEIMFSRFVGTDASHDRLTCVAPARDGVCAAGYATVAGTNNADAMVVKYSSLGVLEWSSIFGDATGAQQMTGVTYIQAAASQSLDQDKIVVVGNDSVATKGGIVIAYSGTGTVLWQKNIVGCTLTGICNDGSYVYVSGYTTTSTYGADDLVVFKINVGNSSIDKKIQIGAAASDTAKGIAIDKDKGVVYVVGSTASIGTYGGDDMLLVKLETATLTRIWAMACGYTTGDAGHSVAVGTGGWVYLCGLGAGGAVVLVFDENKNSLWQREIKEHQAGTIAGPLSVSTDNPSTDGKIFVTCRSSAGPIVIKMDRDSDRNNIANIIAVSKSTANVAPIELKSTTPAATFIDVTPAYSAQQKKPVDKTPALLQERNWPLVGHAPISLITAVSGISGNIVSPRLSGATGLYLRGGDAYFNVATAYGSGAPPAITQRDSEGNLAISLCEISLYNINGGMAQHAKVVGRCYTATTSYMNSGDTVVMDENEYTIYAGGANRFAVLNG